MQVAAGAGTAGPGEGPATAASPTAPAGPAPRTRVRRERDASGHRPLRAPALCGVSPRGPRLEGLVSLRYSPAGAREGPGQGPRRRTRPACRWGSPGQARCASREGRGPRPGLCWVCKGPKAGAGSGCRSGAAEEVAVGFCACFLKKN